MKHPSAFLSAAALAGACAFALKTGAEPPAMPVPAAPAVTYIARPEYIATLDRAGRSPGDFIRFVADRVCETQKELLRLMGQSTVLGGDRANPPNGDRANDGANENAVAAELLSAIAGHPGLRTHQLATFVGKSIPTVSRYLKTLKDAGKIEFRGAPKNGGYFAV